MSTTDRPFLLVTAPFDAARAEALGDLYEVETDRKSVV